MKGIVPRSKVLVGVVGATLIAAVLALAVFASGDAHPEAQPASDATIAMQLTQPPAPAATIAVQMTQPPAPDPTQVDLRGPDGKPRPNATQLAQLTQIIEYNEAHNITPGPPFEGQLNGFTFMSQQPYSGSGPIPTPDLTGLPCGGGTRTMPSPQGLFAASKLSEHGSPLVNSSGLDFDATYVPSSFLPDLLQWQDTDTSGHVFVNECVDTSGAVVSFVGFGETWISSDGPSNDPTWRSLRHFSIDRSLISAPRIAARYAREQLEATTINGRPAIVIHPSYTGEELYVFMRDETSFWSVSSQDLTVDELVKIAEGLK